MNKLLADSVDLKLIIGYLIGHYLLV